MAGNWDWERSDKVSAFNIPTVVVILTAICVIFYGAQFVLPARVYEFFLPYLVFVPSYSFTSGNPFTALSVLGYSFMHGSWMHLLMNMAWFIVFGSPLANRIGAFRFLAFWVISAIVSILPYALIHMHESVSVVGASGVISAMMGAAGRYGFQRVFNYKGDRPEFGPIMPIGAALRSERVMLMIGFWILTDIATGAFGNTGIAWEAHIAGLIFGFLTIRFFDPHPAAPY